MADLRLDQAVKPLNERLKPQNMLVWWDEATREWLINTKSATPTRGIFFDLSHRKIEQLLRMDDDDLFLYCKMWG